LSDARNIGLLFITVCFPCGGLWRRDLPISLMSFIVRKPRTELCAEYFGIFVSDT
jgi:hypothetical protein